MNTLTHHVPFISLQATHCMVSAWWEYCISVCHFTYFPDSLLSVLLILVAVISGGVEWEGHYLLYRAWTCEPGLPPPGLDKHPAGKVR